MGFSITQNLLSRMIGFNGTSRRLPIQLDITNACNLTCSHCYHSHHKNTGALKLTEWFEVIDQYEALLKKLKMDPKFTICGGEPMVNPQLPQIIDYITDKWGKQTPISILTNGTIIPNKFIDKIASGYNIIFQVSLDGSSAKTHNLFRGSGNFERAISGVKILKKKGFRILLQATLSSRNKSEIENYFKLAFDLKVEAMNFVRLVTQGNGKKLVESQIDRPLEGYELKEALSEILKNSKEYDVTTSRLSSLYYLLDPSAGANEKFGFAIIVGYKGDLKVSSRADFSVGNLRDQSLSKLFLKHPVFKNLRKGKVEFCGSCAFFKRCGGSRNASYAAYGHFFGPDPGCWIYQDSLKNIKKEKYNEAI